MEHVSNNLRINLEKDLCGKKVSDVTQRILERHISDAINALKIKGLIDVGELDYKLETKFDNETGVATYSYAIPYEDAIKLGLLTGNEVLVDCVISPKEI